MGAVTINETIVVALAVAATTTLIGGPLLAGAVLMPLLFAVIIRHTKRLPGWAPSYLYVVPVLAPAAGFGAAAVGGATLPVDLAAFVILPLLGGLALPLRTTVRNTSAVEFRSRTNSFEQIPSSDCCRAGTLCHPRTERLKCASSQCVAWPNTRPVRPAAVAGRTANSAVPRATRSGSRRSPEPNSRSVRTVRHTTIRRLTAGIGTGAAATRAGSGSSGGSSSDGPSRTQKAAQNVAKANPVWDGDSEHWESEGTNYDDDQLPYLVSDYGETLVEARRDAGLQREELADELGAPEKDLLAVEQGRATQAGVGGGLIEALEERLDVTLAE